MNFPKFYLRIIKSLQPHSDNKYYPKDNIYLVKKLPFQSEAATPFIQNLDRVIQTINQADGKRCQKHQRVWMMIPAPTLFPKAPKGLTLDFYNVEWYNKISPVKRQINTNLDTVAFLKNPVKLIQFKDSDEQMSEKKFTQKHWDHAIKAYNLDFLEKNKSKSKEENDKNDTRNYGESIDLTFSNGEDNDEDQENEYEEEEQSEEEYEQSEVDINYSEFDEEDVMMESWEAWGSSYCNRMTQNEWEDYQ